MIEAHHVPLIDAPPCAAAGNVVGAIARVLGSALPSRSIQRGVESSSRGFSIIAYRLGCGVARRSGHRSGAA
ncbi:MAG TPA: hypothetical protein VFP84_18440, partial [Kofleriaceae bacterium]|nr:hypothetical protein [Kofleriaceae bacterium]